MKRNTSLLLILLILIALVLTQSSQIILANETEIAAEGPYETFVVSTAEPQEYSPAPELIQELTLLTAQKYEQIFGVNPFETGLPAFFMTIEGAKDGTYTVVTWLDDDRFAAQAADSSSLDAEPLPNNELSDQYTIIFSSSQQAFVYASRNDAVSRAILESNIDIELSLIDSDAAKMQISQAMSDLGFLDVSVNKPQVQATAIQTVTASDEAGNRINIAYDLSSKSIIYLELDQLQEQLQ